MYGLHAYLPSSIHAICTYRRRRSEHRAGPYENYFIQVALLAMSQGDISLIPAEIVAARRQAYDHHRLRLMQRNVQASTRPNIFFFLFPPSPATYIHQ